MRLLNLRYLFVAFAYLVFSVSGPANAETATDWATTDQSRLRLISGVDGVKGRDSLRIGLQIKLAPGWKTYWRNPGDAGIPPRLNWDGSENLKAAMVSWPLPAQFHAYGFSSWGYHDEVVFPIDVTLMEAGEPVKLKLSLQLGICEDVCIPYEHDFTLTLDANNAELTQEAEIIETFARQVPAEIGSDGSLLSNATAETEGDQTFSITVSANKQPFEDPSIIVEGKEGAYFDLISTTLSEDRMGVTFRVKGNFPSKSDQLPGQNITVTVFDKAMTGEKTLQIN